MLSIAIVTHHASSSLTQDGRATSFNPLLFIRPHCFALTGGDGTRDILYSFTVTAPFGQGFEIMSLAYDEAFPDAFYPGLRDTLVAVHDASADGCTPHSADDPVDQLCSDDASLPGGSGSRVYGVLPPGDYTIVASFFNDRANGPYQLLIMFTDATSGPIRPVCSDRFCGLASAQVAGVQQECGLKVSWAQSVCGCAAQAIRRTVEQEAVMQRVVAHSLTTILFDVLK